MLMHILYRLVQSHIVGWIEHHEIYADFHLNVLVMMRAACLPYFEQ